MSSTSDSKVHATATGFDGVAAEYEAARPTYEASIVARMVELLDLGPGRRVADVGAGTGKLTRALVETGAEVVAVEPMAGMREQLRRSLPDPGLTVLDGTAETMPFGDAELDAITAAQAFHWFAGPAALAEFRRVLSPGGHLAVIFNRRDVSSPVQGAIDHLLAPYRGDTPSWERHDWVEWLEETEYFGAPTTASAPWVQHLDIEGLVGRVASISFVARLDDRTRARVLAAVRDLHAASRTDEQGRVTLDYTTQLWVLPRRDPDA